MWWCRRVRTSCLRHAVLICQTHENICLRHDNIMWWCRRVRTSCLRHAVLICLTHENICLRHDNICLRHEKICLTHENICLRHDNIILRHEGLTLLWRKRSYKEAMAGWNKRDYWSQSTEAGHSHKGQEEIGQCRHKKSFVTWRYKVTR